MTLGQGLYAKLAGDSDITGIVGDRIYPVVVPTDAALPCLSWGVVSSERHGQLGQRTTTWRTRLGLSAWAATYAGAQALAQELRETLDKDPTGWTGATVLGCSVADGQRDGYDPETETHECALELLVIHKEA